MKMRPPATPIITVDPYFSVWNFSNTLAGNDSFHWTGSPNRISGRLLIDDKKYLFMGRSDFSEEMMPITCDIDAFSTKYSFECDEAILNVKFTAPLIIDELEILSRPINYMQAEIINKDGNKHKYVLEVTVCDEICLNKKFDYPTIYNSGKIGSISYASLENSEQNPLNKDGDDVRIDWGRFILATDNDNSTFDSIKTYDENGEISNSIDIKIPFEDKCLIVFAYDDVKSIEYFHNQLDAYWKKYSTDIFDVIQKSIFEYDGIISRCEIFSNQMISDAKTVGGDEYAEILTLAYRQTIAAHKLCLGNNEKPLFISKECFSNGCAATVDVTYPSAPLFLLYNPTLLLGMLDPIFEYSESDEWDFDFAPHDLGRYPILNGQAYCDGEGKIMQMPVEECGNMVILTAAYVKASGDVEFAKKHIKTLEKWVAYLVKNGEDPENQLCTDDFAGHSAHNCNLALKAIMGIASYGLICGLIGECDTEKVFLQKAKAMAQSWEKRAVKSDGSYRMVFDNEDTFSLKYNAVWDVVFKTDLFSGEFYKNEINSYYSRFNKFGIPLDNRADYTKSDWIMWCATLLGDYETVSKFAHPLWCAYNETNSRVPLGDWYDTKNATMICFRNRTVQGGLFMPILRKKKKMRF